MKQSTRLWALIAVGAIAYASVPAQASGGRGSIRGIVMDASGSPLIGVAVLVLGETEAAKPDKDKVVKRASTDGEGKFTAAGITPGKYRVKAEAEGFNTVELDADVKPNKVTIFDSIQLRRITTLSDEINLNTDSKFAARRARGTIFHYDAAKKDPGAVASDPTIALTPRSTELHGAVNAFAQSN